MNEENTDIKLTKKQREFIEAYLEFGNGTRAAIRAGYPEKSAAQMASKLLHKNESIKEALRLERQQRREALGINEDWSILQLMDVLEKCKEPIPVLEWDSEAHAYVKKGVYQFDSKGALGAIKQINDLLGIGGGEDNAGGNITIINDLGGLNDKKQDG